MIEFLLNEFIHLNGYKINVKKFNEYFLSHPDYPSLSAIENTLDTFQIENVVSQFKNEDFEDLPEVFISAMKTNPSDLVLIIKKDSQVQITSINKKSIKIQIALFLNQWTGIVVAVEKNIEDPNSDFNTVPSSKNKFERFQKFILFGGLGLVLGFAFWKSSISEITYVLISLIGLYYCIEIYKNQHGEESSIIDKICNDHEKEKSPCQKVIQSDSIDIFGLKLSDIGLFYFITAAIFSLFIRNTQFLIIVLSILSLPVIGYSLYIQVIKEKKLCKVCLILISILFIQSGISLVNFNYHFSLEVFLLSLIYFFFALPIFIFVNRTINKNTKLEHENATNLRFKRNYDIFKRELLTTPKINLGDKNLFSLGNKDAKIHITLISNLDCRFCSEAHGILKEIYAKNSNDISLQVRFNFSDKEISEQSRNIFKILNHYYSVSEKHFFDALTFWYKERDYDSFIKRFGLYENQNIDLIQIVNQENIINGLNFTPAFLINGQIYPKIYEKEDILYFIQDLIDDEVILKR
jgi:uncharacterized membrane protein